MSGDRPNVPIRTVTLTTDGSNAPMLRSLTAHIAAQVFNPGGYEAMRDTIKFGTVVWLILGLIVPLWPVSLPLCWWNAYRSYKRGDEPRRDMADLQTAIALHREGSISDADLARVKRSVLR